MTELKSLLNSASHTPESTERVGKIAESYLDSQHKDGVSSFQNFKDINIPTLITLINTCKTEKRETDVFVRFLTHTLTVCESSPDFLLGQTTTEQLVTLSKELYTHAARDELVIRLMLLVS